ncbi:hypothetical protein [Sphingomonas bacterium]|uniref:hypothetical protein n=1 Tax=Sphingomonas bacterium TaxID=1895847 RepID=UPI001576E13F|nr:hypothetical protein [Sphingomonas bacterium]
MTDLTLAPPPSAAFDRFAAAPPLAIAGGLVAGLLLTAGYALQPLWWTPWLAPIAMLAVCRTERDARVAGSVAGAAAMLAVWSYYVAQIGWGVALAITALRIGGWRLSARLALIAARRRPLWLAALVLPASQAGFEVATLTLSSHGAAESLAYSQMAHPALVQVASLGGVSAVVFLVLLPGSLAGLWFALRPTRRDALAALACVCAIGLAATAWTAVAFHAVASAPRMRVALVATDELPGIPTDWGRVWSAYRPAVLSVERGTALTVLPEKVARLDMTAIPRVERDVARAARAVGTTIVVGLEVRDRIGERGRALAMDPAGRAIWYDKQRLLPGFEDRDRPGHTPVTIGVAGAIVGLAICKDMHIPSIGREYRGVSVMAVPAWDFGRDGWMGARMTALRAVENGYAVARSAREGRLGAYDPAGRAIVERSTTARAMVVAADLPMGVRPTLYARVGDLFGWACLVATTLLLVMSGWTPRGRGEDGMPAKRR